MCDFPTTHKRNFSEKESKGRHVNIRYGCKVKEIEEMKCDFLYDE